MHTFAYHETTKILSCGVKNLCHKQARQQIQNHTDLKILTSLARKTCSARVPTLAIIIKAEPEVVIVSLMKVVYSLKYQSPSSG